MKPDCIKNGAVHWSRNGEQYASVGIAVNMLAQRPFLELNYNCNGEPIKYKVYLVSVSSNIGRGKVWYFLCPNTSKRCRKLYMINTYFLHRSAFKGAMYEKQTYSLNARLLFNVWDRMLSSEKIYEQLYSKHFKKYYAGKPTRRYLMLSKRLREAGEIPKNDLLTLLKG